MLGKTVVCQLVSSMNKNIKAAVYIRVATFEQVDDRTNQMKEFADKNGYEISDFIVEQ